MKYIPYGSLESDIDLIDFKYFSGQILEDLENEGVTVYERNKSF